MRLLLWFLLGLYLLAFLAAVVMCGLTTA